MHACVRACRVRVAPKCKHGHVLRGNTCRAVPVKINHAPLGGEGASRRKERERSRGGSPLEEIREKGRSSRALSAGLVLSRAIQENEQNEGKDCAEYRRARKDRVPVLENAKAARKGSYFKNMIQRLTPKYL